MAVPENNALIELRDVSFSFGEGHVVLRGVSLEVRAGELLAVVGANGSGKSTLARHLNGLLTPGAGEVRAFGRALSSREAIMGARAQVGMVFQDPETQSVASLVSEDVAFGPCNLGLPPAEVQQRVAEALEAVGLGGFERREVHGLSGGQQQLVAIAGALAMRPQVLVLDEADSMLDAPGRAAVAAIARECVEAGTAVVMITHFMEEAAQADRLLALDAGAVAFCGAPAEFFGNAQRVHALGLALPGEHALSAPQGVRSLEGRSAAVRSAISVEGVSFSYDGGETWALRDVSLEVREGSITGVVGATGSGKSTLAKLMNGLLKPSAGSVTACGVRTSEHKDIRPICAQVGLVFQRPEQQLFANTVAEDVAFGPRNMGCGADEAQLRVREALEQVGLDYERVANMSPFDLSGGEQRCAALAGILAMKPQVLVLDEPTAGLDPAGRTGFCQLIAQLNAAGTTIVLISHDMDVINALCDQVITLSSGRVQ